MKFFSSTGLTPLNIEESEKENKIEAAVEEIETATKEQLEDNEDDEIIIKRPNIEKTPNNLKRRLTIETPEVDLAKFKPVKYELNTSMEVATPSKWVAGSEPLYGLGTQPFSRQSFSAKRKRDDDPYYNGISTPDTPYGAYLHG